MAGLEEDVGLNISDALASVDQLASTAQSTLTAALVASAEAFATAISDIAVGTIADQLGAIASADIGPVAGELTQLADAADQANTNLEGTVSHVEGAVAGLDTLGGAAGTAAAAETELGNAAGDAVPDITDLGVAANESGGDLQSLADSAGSASSSVQDMGGSVSAGASKGATGLKGLASEGLGIGTAMEIAQGKTGGLIEGLHGLGGGATIAAGGLLAVGVATGEFFSAGLKAQTAADRLRIVFGDTAEAVNKINVGGLTGDLETLAVKAGSTGVGLQLVAANLGQFAQQAGQTQKESANLAGSFEALVLKAAAVNPTLGGADQAASRLFTALITGRDRALVPFGLGLDSASIKAEALSLGLIQAGEKLTPFDKVMAGITLATEKAGDTLGTKFAQGADQASTKARALKAELEQTIEKLGQPIVSPLLDIGKDLLPAAEAIGKIAGTVVGVLVPALGAIAPVLVPAVVSFGALKVALEGAALAQVVLTADFAAGVGATLSAALATDALTASSTALIGVVAAGLISYKLTTLALESMKETFYPTATANNTVTDALAKLDSQAHEVARTSGSDLVPAFQHLVDTSIQTKNALHNVFPADAPISGDRLVETMIAFDKVARTNITSATQIADHYRNNTAIYATMDATLNRLNREHAASALAQFQEAQAADRAAVSVGTQQKLLDSSVTSLKSYADGTGSSSQALKDLTASQTAATDAFTLYKHMLDASLDPQLAQVDATIRFRQELEKIAAAYAQPIDATHTLAQNQDAQTLAAESGIRAAIAGRDAAYSYAVQQGRSGTAAAEATKVFEDESEALKNQLIQSGLTEDGAVALLRQFGLFPAVLGAAATAVGQTLPASLAQGVVGVNAAGADIGEEFGAGLAQGIADSKYKATQAAQATAESVMEFTRQLLGIASPSRRARDEIGIPFVEGFALGITQSHHLVTDATRGLSVAALAVPVGGRAAVRGGDGGSSSSVDDWSIKIEHLHVESPTPDPVRLAVKMVSKLRSAQYLMGN